MPVCQTRLSRISRLFERLASVGLFHERKLPLDLRASADIFHRRLPAEPRVRVDQRQRRPGVRVFAPRPVLDADAVSREMRQSAALPQPSSGPATEAAAPADPLSGTGRFRRRRRRPSPPQNASQSPRRPARAPRVRPDRGDAQTNGKKSDRLRRFARHLRTNAHRNGEEVNEVLRRQPCKRMHDGLYGNCNHFSNPHTS